MKFTKAVKKVYNDGKEVAKSFFGKWFARGRKLFTYENFKKLFSWSIRAGKTLGREIRKFVIAFLADTIDGLLPLFKKVLKYAVLVPIACTVAPVLHPHAGTVWAIFGGLFATYFLLSFFDKVVKTMLTDDKAETETKTESETVEVKVEK